MFLCQYQLATDPYGFASPNFTRIWTLLKFYIYAVFCRLTKAGNEWAWSLCASSVTRSSDPPRMREGVQGRAYACVCACGSVKVCAVTLCACVRGLRAGWVMEGVIAPRGGGGAGAWRDGAVTYRERWGEGGVRVRVLGWWLWVCWVRGAVRWGGQRTGRRHERHYGAPRRAGRRATSVGAPQFVVLVFLLKT